MFNGRYWACSRRVLAWIPNFRLNFGHFFSVFGKFREFSCFQLAEEAAVWWPFRRVLPFFFFRMKLLWIIRFFRHISVSKGRETFSFYHCKCFPTCQLGGWAFVSGTHGLLLFVAKVPSVLTIARKANERVRGTVRMTVSVKRCGQEFFSIPISAVAFWNKHPIRIALP